jgi:hypothetical protein
MLSIVNKFEKRDGTLQLDENTLARWRSLVDEKPEAPLAWCEFAKALATSGAVDELLSAAAYLGADHPDLAAYMLRAATQNSPGEKSYWFAYCSLAAAQVDTKQENLRWTMFYKHHRAEREVQLGYTQILIRQSRFAAASTIAPAALESQRETAEFREILIDICEKARDWWEAVTQMKVLIAAYPQRAELASRLDANETQLRRATSQTLAPNPIDQPILSVPPITPGQEREIRELLRSFESLGSNCEFGLLQSQFGAEPSRRPPRNIACVTRSRAGKCTPASSQPPRNRRKR